MTSHHHDRGVACVSVARVSGSASTHASDELSVEEPLDIRVGVYEAERRSQTTVAVTMRTPGADAELAAGFLFTEGVVNEPSDVDDIEIEGPNCVSVRLRRGAVVDSAHLDRHSFVSSSCGVCGKRSIAAVRVSRRHRIAPAKPRLSPEVIHALPDTLRADQLGFARTGGLHASALFDANGRLLALREDVGRHNALDKLIGAEFLADRVPLAARVVLVSGRVSFELVQKAALAGVPVLAAVGAPSSLAVDLARECGMTLLGFVRGGRFNVYSDLGRIPDVDPSGWSPGASTAHVFGQRKPAQSSLNV